MAKDYSRALRLIKNKYVLITIGFLLIFLFISQNNLFFTLNLRHDVDKLHKEERLMKEEIANDSAESLRLKNNKEAVEKFAREHYYMKAADEDIFVITTTDKH